MGPAVHHGEQSAARGPFYAPSKRGRVLALQQSLDAYRYFRHLIVQLDAELKSYLQELPTSTAAQSELPKGTKLRQKERSDPAFDLRSELYRVVGVDLTDVPGISVMTAQTIVSEIGPGVTRFPNASAFRFLARPMPGKASERRKSSLHSHAQGEKSNCECIENGSNVPVSRQKLFGRLLRRMKRKLGAPNAVTATAHKMARIIYHLLRFRQPYDESVFAHLAQSNLQKTELRLRLQAAKLAFQLIQAEA